MEGLTGMKNSEGMWWRGGGLSKLTVLFGSFIKGFKYENV